MGLADAYGVLPWYDLTVEPVDVYESARASAILAYQLDPSIGEVYASLGYISLHYELDWVNAERYLKKAVEMVPGSPPAHLWYANLLALVGRFEEAVTQCEQALALDPSSNALVWGCAGHFMMAGRSDEARARHEQALATEISIPWIFESFARELGENEPKDSEKAGELLAEFATLFGYPFPDRMATVAGAFSGDREAQIDAVAVLNDLAGRTVLDRSDLLFLYGQSAPPDVFFDVLGEAVNVRYLRLPFVPLFVSAWVPGLAEDPRWEDFLSLIGDPGQVN